jgi:hypothetical protein
MTYRCYKCGQVHDDLPDLGIDYPDYYFGVPEEERDARVKLTGDTCIIDNEEFFIRGLIEIPIHDYERTFGFGVWVSQKKENFYTYVENSDSDEIGPFFGWLSNNISYYAKDTLLLKTMAHFTSDGLRPRIEIEPTDHPLAQDQINGITLDKAWEIVHFYKVEINE